MDTKFEAGINIKIPKSKYEKTVAFYRDILKLDVEEKPIINPTVLYEIDKVFANENDVCVIYNIDMFGKDKILNCGLYHLDHGKISSLNVIFDPRPVLEK